MPRMNPTRRDTLESLKADYHDACAAAREARRRLVQYAFICIENGESTRDVQQAMGIDHNLAALIDQRDRLERWKQRKKDQK